MLSGASPTPSVCQAPPWWNQMVLAYHWIHQPTIHKIPSDGVIQNTQLISFKSAKFRKSLICITDYINVTERLPWQKHWILRIWKNYELNCYFDQCTYVSSLFIKINMIIHRRSMYWKYMCTWYKHERKKIWIYIMCKLLLHIKRNFTWIVSIQLLARKGVAMMYDNLKSNKINNFFTVQILII